jgi:lysophospholipase L1-like esterase
MALGCGGAEPLGDVGGTGTETTQGSSGTEAVSDSEDTRAETSTSTTATTMDAGTTEASPETEGDSTGGTGETGETEGESLGPAAACFDGVFVNDPDLGPDYDQFDPIIGSHCYGTNHQEIAGVERVVFLGDSVTVGTPPSQQHQFYRSRLANAVRDAFGLSYGFAEIAWKGYDPLSGTSIVMQAGDFWSCARWGARNDDLMQDDTQLEDCFPPATRNDRTLVFITSGGNDIANLTKKAIDRVPQQELWDQAADMVALKEEAVQWLKDPEVFPNGNFVVFSNLYEFTDGTGEVEACDASQLAGFDDPVPAPDELADLVVWIEEQYMRIAVETGSDMIFALEEFCGRGFNRNDPTAPCYRGPGEPIWFDLTCTHPNPAGHQQLADMFMAIVQE